MTSPIEKKISAPHFAPSPPLSSSAASDCDPDGDSIPTTQVSGAERQRLGQQTEAHLQPCAAVDSSPRSISSHNSTHARARSVPSATSSFTSGENCADQADGGRSPAESKIEGQATESPRRHAERGFSDDPERAFSLVRASWQGVLPTDIPSPEWHVLQISPLQYTQLCRRLKDHDPLLLDYFETKLRFDYEPDRGVLVLRLMHTLLHESFQDCILRHLWMLLDRLKTDQDPAVSRLISKIQPTGHATVHLYSGEEVASGKSPDGQLRFIGTTSPQFVLEVGYSQKATSLSQLAKDYFENSDGAIKTVLTINIGYAKPKERRQIAAGAPAAHTAAFSLYRGPDRIHHNTVFRDAHRQPVPDASLRLLLTDLIPDDVLEQLSPQLQHKAGQAVFDLSSDVLCDFLAVAEAQQEADDAAEAARKESQKQAAQGSRKRKSVRWEVDTSDCGEEQSEGSGNSESDHGRQSRLVSRSKRRRTGDATYRSRSRKSGDQDSARPETMGTRSTPRNES